MNRLTRRRFLATSGAVLGASAAKAPAVAARSAAAARLTLACADYVRFYPIAAGDVRLDGVELTWLRGERSEMLRRATGDAAVDGGETSMAQHVMRIDRGDRSLVAVPAFPLRNFTVRDIYVLKGSTLTPKDLGGRRLGIYNWPASGAVWYRHLMRYWGHDVSKATWIVGSPDTTAAVAIPMELPPHVKLAPAGRSLTDLLLAKEIDAFFAPIPPAKYDADDGPIARLVPDFQPVEARYFRETGCYPPQHVIVLARARWEADPSIGSRLVDLFDRCEARFHAGQKLFPYNAPWLMADIEATERVMGPRYHAHGLAANRRVLETFCQGAFDDGLTKRRVAVEDFFGEFLKATPGAAEGGPDRLRQGYGAPTKASAMAAGSALRTEGGFKASAP